MKTAVLDILSGSPETTFDVARALGKRLQGGEVLALVGELGSGKTIFARGVVCGLGSPAYHQVNSPTYVLEQVYPGRCEVHHYDAYRLEGAEELRALGFDEQLGSGAVLVVEWADRVATLLPWDRLVVEFQHGGAERPTERQVRLSGPWTRWGRTLDELRESVKSSGAGAG